MKKKKILCLISEGLGEFRHFTTLDGRMVVGKKVGEVVLRREHVCEPINFCVGAPRLTEGFSIARVEKMRKDVYFYTIEYYTSLRKYSAN